MCLPSFDYYACILSKKPKKRVTSLILCWKERVYSRTSISMKVKIKYCLTTSLLIQLLIKRYLFILFLYFILWSCAILWFYIFLLKKNNWQGRLSEMYDYRERGFFYENDISVKLNQKKLIDWIKNGLKDNLILFFIFFFFSLI